MEFHQPGTSPRPVVDVTFVNSPPVFLKNDIGIHSPTRIISRRPSLSKSVNNASLTIPTFLSPGATLSVTSVNLTRPPSESFLRRELLTGRGYFQGSTRPETRMSSLPSPLKSKALTLSLLV